MIQHALKVTEEPTMISHIPLPPCSRKHYLELLIGRDLLKKVPNIRKSMSSSPHRTPKNVPFLYQATRDGLALRQLIERVYDILGWSDRLQ